MEQQSTTKYNTCRITKISVSDNNEVFIQFDGSINTNESISLIFNEQRTGNELELSEVDHIEDGLFECTFPFKRINKRGSFYIRIKDELYSLHVSDAIDYQIQGYKYKKVQKKTLLELVSQDNALAARTTKFYKNEDLVCLPNYVTNLGLSDGTLKISGYVHNGLLNSDQISLIGIKRGEDQPQFKSSIKLEPDNQWLANLQTDQLNEGIWDFYLEVSNGVQYRLRTESVNIEWNYSALNKDNIIINITPYQTVKGSFSIEVLEQVVTLSNLTFNKKQNNLALNLSGDISGELRKEQMQALVLKEHKEEVYYDYDLHINEDHIGKLQLSSTVSYKHLLDGELKKDKWHCFLKLKQGSLVRIKVVESPDALDSVINLITSPYQLYMYQTVNGNLSLVMEKMVLHRDVVYEEFKGKHLLIEGSANIPGHHDYSDLEKQIVIRDRESDEVISYNIDNYTIDFEQRINLVDLYNTVPNDHKIYDIYIQVRNEHFVLERKLGEEEYEFVKDEVIAKKTVLNKGALHCNLLVTPMGNLKIETFKTSLMKSIYLKYLQQLDRFLFNKKDVWLIGERSDTAQDTGYHFFKYCRENYPNKNIYYVIEPDSTDRKNIDHLGNVVEVRSWKHLRLSAHAKMFITSHDVEYLLPTKPVDWPSYKEAKRVFLQHGILGRKRVEYDKSYYNYPFDLFIVSSTDEKRLVVEEMGYEENEVVVTGLSRFDALEDQSEGNRQILLIPTWREWLTNEERLINSNYYSRYQSLLSNSELHALLKEHGVRLNFYAHYRMQPFLNYFNQSTNENIKVIPQGYKNVQDLIKEHNLMITDYSSVSMDFNYLGKPVVFYQFDYNRFFKNGILREPEKTFLGDIESTEDDLVNRIKSYIESDFKTDKSYNKYMQYLFEHRDQNNCKRIYEEIIKRSEA
ncbi:CDP-glycerol glycerophosphotransferase (TagB/SpsB family) [Alkalibacillus filiformis]|uniref:CDP-glycerol glycerophosphotransferase (TagB/SpsB family) n=1 Tax=Alkalibacillus filiformis TaxID=200990 RepID=A0ABU0DW96_9BACI|nr:CDP-glycerol glycerophosphotransferase family protein [Alkalibacillus filiformis]MDQ0352681.1 CDP-glycerol glycerophosphotransferase (TagB/SpsB family) [Alkalibacillus filiformis]